MDNSVSLLISALLIAVLASVVTSAILMRFVRGHELSKLETIVLKLDHAAHTAATAANVQVEAMRNAAEQLRVLLATGMRSEEAARVVASDLADAHMRADKAGVDAEDSHGRSADAFSRSAP